MLDVLDDSLDVLDDSFGCVIYVLFIGAVIALCVWQWNTTTAAHLREDKFMRECIHNLQKKTDQTLPESAEWCAMEWKLIEKGWWR